jgi:hypothetical protein
MQPRPRTARRTTTQRSATRAHPSRSASPAQHTGTRLIALLSAVALVGGVAAIVPFASPAQAVAVSAALVGDLQSELGCPGDWQPECTATELAPTGVDGQFAAEFTLPAGTWQYKVALNDAWDESYGRNGTGDNAPLVLGGEALVRVTYDDTTHRIGLTPLNLAGDYTAADDALVAAPVRQDGSA